MMASLFTAEIAENAEKERASIPLFSGCSAYPAVNRFFVSDQN
jgi:hypothetical protein